MDGGTMFTQFYLLLETVWLGLIIVAMYFGIRALISLRVLIESAAAYLDAKHR